MKKQMLKTLLIFITIFFFNFSVYATSTYNYYPGYYPNNQVNGYYNPYDYGNTYYNNMNVIPSNSYYYIMGYDRGTTLYCNGLPMISRVPILGGNNYFPTKIANGIIYNAYVSISSWCNENILNKEGIQDYYLNYANIVSETANSIILNVNCSFKRVGIITGHTQFKVNIDISRNRFEWEKVD
ncbi:MAG: hypothetical protein J6P02_03355 [Lachnospiraceae bacterium]|nr:hypothetical protein [Lachnospiraceae bacterium]